MVDLTKLRDEIVQKKALAQAAKAESNVALEELKEITASFSEEEKEALERLGFDVKSLLSINFERLQSDESYLEQFKQDVDTMVQSIYKKLEEQLV